jgi:AraC-like DNA-binding protein
MIGTFILSLFSIYLLSKKIYKPIGELVDTLIDVKDEGNSSEAKNEIEYLAKQVSRIRYENQDLAQTVRENLVSGKKRFLTSLFHGTYNTEMLKSDLEKYDLNWLEEVNYIVRMDVVDSEGASVETVPPNLIDIVSRHIATSFVVESVYIYSGQNYFIIHTEDLEEVEMVLSRAAATIDTVFGLAVTFYLGKPSKSVSNLNYSLMTIEKVFDASSSQIPRCIYDFGDIKNLHKVPAIYPIAIEQKLLASIESNNQGAMDQILTYIFKEYGGAFEDVATRNMLTYALANTINRCAQRLSVEVSEVYGQDAESVYQILSACQNESLLKERTYALIHDILEEGGSIREKQDHTKKEQIEKYVKDNLRNEISLITMADYFQLTPNYMSSIFKEAMNVNFKDYTSRIRFEVSLECLVQTTDISMIELAEKIGLNNTTTLLRLFKKYANCTPSSYLKKIKQI